MLSALWHAIALVAFGSGHVLAATLSDLFVVSARDLRVFRQDTLPLVMMIVLSGALIGVGVLYSIRGRIRMVPGRSGRRVARFSALERSAHWVLAVTLLGLALTGLHKTFGRQITQPFLAPDTYASWTRLARSVHEYISFAFAGALLVVVVLWIRDNRPSRTDIAWLAAGGGVIRARHASAGRFNAGQKIVFWLVAIGGTLMAATGYNMMFPDVVLSGGPLRFAIVLHGLGAALLIGLTIGHAYIGSIGIEGAVDGMIRGHVDENWARQHHDQWARAASTNSSTIK